MLQSLTAPVTLGDHDVTVSASIGIAIADAESSATSLLRDADVAMYQAKTTGKASWVIYEPTMRAAAVQRLQLENELAQALDETSSGSSTSRSSSSRPTASSASRHSSAGNTPSSARSCPTSSSRSPRTAA